MPILRHSIRANIVSYFLWKLGTYLLKEKYTICKIKKVSPYTQWQMGPNHKKAKGFFRVKKIILKKQDTFKLISWKSSDYDKISMSFKYFEVKAINILF